MGRAIMLLMMMTATTMLHAVLAQEAPASAPGPSTDCQTVLLWLSDCLSYVTTGSNLTKPDKPCCPELAGLVKDNPICLCYLLANSNSSNSLGIDVNRALKLPTVCKVQTPPASKCSLLGIPVAAPTASEAPANSRGSGLTPQGPSASISPATNTKSGASKTANSVMAFLAGLVFAVLPMFF